MTPAQKEIIDRARKLVAQLKLMHKHPDYEAVWLCAAEHGLKYDGPKYEKELKALEDALLREKC